jgi:5-methylcytosine-specific restriction endonuclease McrA
MIEQEKTCTRCHEDKPLSEFHKGAWQCKSCKSAWARAYYAEHAMERIAYSREYRQKYPGKISVGNFEYKSSHRDSLIIHHREYRLAHAHEITAYERRRYLLHPEKILAYNHARRARRMAAPGNGYTTADMIRARWEMFGNRCYICGGEAEATDHVKPLARGGGHWPCNLRPICKSCNSKKRAEWPYLPNMKQAQAPLPGMEEATCKQHLQDGEEK